MLLLMMLMFAAAEAARQKAEALPVEGEDPFVVEYNMKLERLRSLKAATGELLEVVAPPPKKKRVRKPAK